jgi:hypothetical protein
LAAVSIGTRICRPLDGCRFRNEILDMNEKNA